MARGAGEYKINWINWKGWQRAAMLRVITETSAEVLAVARVGASIHKYPRSSHGLRFHTTLAGSLEVSTRPTVSGYESRVYSLLPYAASVERGARAHIIRPRPARLGPGLYRTGRPSAGWGGKWLHFYWYRHGYWRFARIVHHPGQSGRHFLRDAIIIVGNRRRMRVLIH